MSFLRPSLVSASASSSSACSAPSLCRHKSKLARGLRFPIENPKKYASNKRTIPVMMLKDEAAYGKKGDIVAMHRVPVFRHFSTPWVSTVVPIVRDSGGVPIIPHPDAQPMRQYLHNNTSFLTTVADSAPILKLSELKRNKMSTFRKGLPSRLELVRMVEEERIKVVEKEEAAYARLLKREEELRKFEALDAPTA